MDELQITSTIMHRTCLIMYSSVALILRYPACSNSPEYRPPLQCPSLSGATPPPVSTPIIYRTPPDCRWRLPYQCSTCCRICSVYVISFPGYYISHLICYMGNIRLLSNEVVLIVKLTLQDMRSSASNCSKTRVDNLGFGSF